MKLALAFVVGAALTIGSAYADDHHFQAIQSGGLFIDPVTHVITNKAGHVMPDAPGQGSPFSGNHQCTPATDTGAAQDHANVKPKGADDVADCAEDE
jgi:hypothetical protein